MTWSLHPGAVQDLAGILDFYSERAGSIVAQRFLAEFERVAEMLVEHPRFGTPAASGRRAFPRANISLHGRVSSARFRYSHPHRPPSAPKARLRRSETIVRAFGHHLGTNHDGGGP
ncbi:type II toxin-antitoxin system RelE/ParE family toxin [Variovorax sp. LjRoot84]|uniref:type II toxin-antitoxin system RelE/ParE family toxin n=1 Tax=Variovorax sp. LjRoot84 TaxID=3342340 RepID=UPI003F519F94